MRRMLAVAVVLILMLAACAGSEEPENTNDAGDTSGPAVEESVAAEGVAPQSVVAEDYTSMADQPVQSSETMESKIVDGALVVTVVQAEQSASASWPLPETDEATITAVWGASEQADLSGTWGLVLGSKDEGSGVMLACWNDGTPPELVDLATKSVLAVASDGTCGDTSEMTLSVNNSLLGDLSSITFQGAGSSKTAYMGDQLYPLEDAMYTVFGDPGFSVRMSSISVQAP